MESKNDLLSKETGSMSESKKALYNRLKTTMKKEAQEALTGNTRRGFLHAVLTGGAAVLGVSALTVIGSSPIAEAVQCAKGFACAEDYVCPNSNGNVVCGQGFTCAEGYNSCTEACEVSSAGQTGRPDGCVNISIVQ